MNKSEEYLDSLLYGVSGKTNYNKRERRRVAKMHSDEQFEREFEREIENLGMDDFLEQFEEELMADDNLVLEGEEDEDHFFDNLENIVKDVKNETEPSEEYGEDVFAEPSLDDWMEPSLESSTDSDDAGALENTQEEGTELEVNTLEDDAWTESGDTPSVEESLPEGDVPQEEAATEPETEQTSEETIEEISELLAALPNDDGLASLGDALKQGALAEDELDASIALGEEEDEQKPKEKLPFFKRLARLLFGEEEEEKPVEEVEVAPEPVVDPSLENLSDEERQIIESMNSAQKSGEQTKSDKHKKKKQKKEKKPKEKKAKKEKVKKEKAPKEKKPKKPKQVDLSPPLPRGPVILVFVMSVSVIVLVVLAANLLGYSGDMETAKAFYNQQDYVEAYEVVDGMKVKEKDTEFAQKVELLALMQKTKESAEMLYDSGKYTMSLDSYICAIGRYHAKYEDAQRLEITQEMDTLYLQICKQLKKRFHVKQDEAASWYAIEDREEYSRQLRDKLKELGLQEKIWQED